MSSKDVFLVFLPKTCNTYTASSSFATCTSTDTSQRLNGINGDQTGSSHDSKQLHDAVTNCDHFWLPPPFAP